MDKILCLVLIFAIVIMTIIVIYLIRIIDTTDIKKMTKALFGMVFLCYGIYICSDVVTVLMRDDVKFIKEELKWKI
jgi:hypothetical protein